MPSRATGRPPIAVTLRAARSRSKTRAARYKLQPFPEDRYSHRALSRSPGVSNLGITHAVEAAAFH